MSGKTECRLFDEVMPQISTLNAYFVTIYPDTALSQDESMINFTINGSGNEYLDLNDTLLTVRMKYIQSNKMNYTIDLPFRPVNFLMNSLFKDIKLTMNNKHIEGGSDYYPFKATIEDIFNFDRATKSIQLRPKGYYESDTERGASVVKSNPFELCGTLRLDFFNQPQYLLPGIDVRLALTRTESLFTIDGAADVNTKTNLYIYDAFLRVRKVKVNASVEVGHAVGLLSQNAIYSYNATKCVRYSVSQGQWEFKKESIFSGGMTPKFVCVCFVSQDAYNGINPIVSPFEFKHFNVKQVDLFLDGHPLPYQDGYSLNFESGMCQDAYMRSIIQSVQHLNKNIDNGISYEDFVEGRSTFFTFNLTPDFDFRVKQVPKDT